LERTPPRSARLVERLKETSVCRFFFGCWVFRSPSSSFLCFSAAERNEGRSPSFDVWIITLFFSLAAREIRRCATGVGAKCASAIYSLGFDDVEVHPSIPAFADVANNAVHIDGIHIELILSGGHFAIDRRHSAALPLGEPVHRSRARFCEAAPRADAILVKLDDRFLESCHKRGIHLSFQAPI
jgi:hypothetical protein